MDRRKKLKTSPSEVLSIMDTHEASKSQGWQQQQQQQDCKSGHNAVDHLIPTKQSLQELRHQALAATNVQCDPSIPLDQLMTMCQALVNSNREIWDRCKPFCCHCTKLEDESTANCTFFRVSQLRVRTSNASSNEIEMSVERYVAKCLVGIPISLPARLGQLFVNPRPEKDDIMADYGLFLRQAVLLIDDLVPFFLHEFKAFLEMQKEALQKIDVWLFKGTQSDEQVFTLQDQHGVDIAWGNYTGLSQKDSRSSHDEYYDGDDEESFYACCRCWKECKEHDEDPKTGLLRCRTKDGDGCFRHPQRNQKSLLRCPMDGRFLFDLTIATQEDRRCLDKFLEFIDLKKSRARMA